MSNVEKMYGKNKNIPEALYKVRHSLAHVMAEAVLDFFPEAKPTIGPPIDTGFYYDFAVEKPFTPEDLEKIQARMKEVLAKNVGFAQREVSEAEARALFGGNPFKLELIDGLTKGEDDMGEKTEDGSPKTDSSAVSRPPSAVSRPNSPRAPPSSFRAPHVNVGTADCTRCTTGRTRPAESPP